MDKKDKEFELIYNAFSVGWHLRKILEVEPEIFSDPKHYDRFIAWLERHGIKPKKHENPLSKGNR